MLDALLWLQSFIVLDPTSTPLLDYTYTYDSVGNILTKTTEHGNYSYGYDAVSRLLTADNPVLADEAYTYDDVGNRLTSADVSGSWSYNTNNELLGYADVAYDYDANGNLTQITIAGSVVWTYTYDAANRLVHVEDGTGTISADYYYDPFGRRLWKDVGGTRTYFFYSEEGLIAEYDASGVEIRSYGYRPDSTWTTDPLWLKEGGSYYWYQNDHLGTPQKLINPAGTVVWSAQYSAFGKADIQVETVTNNLRFPGQYADTETGLYYNFQRYYDPRIGRYVRLDPIGFAGRDVDLYGYARDNPVNYTDILGLVIQCNCIDKYLDDNGVTGWMKEGEYTYRTGPEFAYNRSHLISEILGTMIESVRVFAIKELQQEWLVQHVNARREVVDSALNFTPSRVGFSATLNLNSTYWSLFTLTIKGDSAYDAIQDVLNQTSAVYAMACLEATKIVMLSGIAKAMGKSEFDSIVGSDPLGRIGRVARRVHGVSESDWIPGDWGYIQNMFLTPEPGEEGENIIYVGNNRWWGHGPSPRIRSLEEWKNSVRSWNSQPDAPVLPARIFPRLGLEN